MTTRKPQGYWQKLGNVQQELKGIADELGHFPTHRELKRLNQSGLANAVWKYFNGLDSVREEMAYEPPTTPKGYWQDLDNVLNEARTAMEEQGWDQLPSSDILRERSYNSLASAISRYHGGYHKFRKNLGLSQKQIAKGLWKDINFALQEAKRIMEVHNYDMLPQDHILRKLNAHGLCHSIYKYHGGLHRFRKLLTEHITGKPQKQQLEELLDEYIAA